MSSWKSIKAKTLGKKKGIYIWEKEKLVESEFQFIGAYALYGYWNDLLYAGITETRDVGTRVMEHIKAKGSQASSYICKQLDRSTAEFNGYNTGYEQYIYRIEVYEFKKPNSHIWFEQYLIKEYNPICNIKDRTDLPETNKIVRYAEWDERREMYFKSAKHRNTWSPFERDATIQNRNIEQVVLLKVAEKMGYHYPYFYLNSPSLPIIRDGSYPNEDEFVKQLIEKWEEKGQTYTSEKIYKMARDIGLSGNPSELDRLGKSAIPLSTLIPS